MPHIRNKKVNEQGKLFERDDHFQVYKKQERSMASIDSGLYKKYKHYPKEIDEVVEYFKHEERKRRGFSSPYLKVNPFQNYFESYVISLEEEFKHLGDTEANLRLLSSLEIKHKIALATFA